MTTKKTTTLLTANGNRRWSWFSGHRVPPTPTTSLPPITIHLRTIGREHSGKTAIKVGYARGPLRGAQPSGLELTAADPKVLAKWLDEWIEAFERMTDEPLPATLAA